MILRGRRLRRGALELTMPEVKIDLDADGRVCGAHLVENTESHQIIEEFMLAANEAVAELSARGRACSSFAASTRPPTRASSRPSPSSSPGWASRSRAWRAASSCKSCWPTSHGKPEEQAVNYALLRSLQRAVYSPEEEGHYALASECYCHFTSPIRRYPDLTIHRLLDALLTGKKPRNDFDELAVLGEHCSDRERRAEAAERELTKVKLLDYLSSAHRRGAGRRRHRRRGVRPVRARASSCRPKGWSTSARWPTTSTASTARSHTLTGHRAGNRYRLGDRVRVAVARVDVDRRELDFRIVARDAKRRRPPMPQKDRKSKQQRAEASRRKNAYQAQGQSAAKRQA